MPGDKGAPGRGCRGDRSAGLQDPPQGFSGAPRFAGEPTANWNRWDAPGATLYYADSLECAFAETLAHLRRPPEVPDPFLKSAAHLGVTYAEFRRLVEQDEGESGFTATGVLPPSWRRSRSIFEVRLPDSGWWVDITHPDTLAALDHALGELLDAARRAAWGISAGINLSHVLGHNRELTTLIASTLRDLDLFTGETPLGIRYLSRWGTGTCWALWSSTEPEISVGPSRDGSMGIAVTTPVHIAPLGQRTIETDDPALLSVVDRYGLTLS